MTKYLEQTSWLLNPHPDRRNQGRNAKQCWLPGTRWVLDDNRGILTGGGMRITPGELANTIIANCKEVEPGFGAIVDEFDYKNVIGRLIDQGKIAVKDIQDALKEDQQSDVDDEVEDESSEPLLGPLVEYENFRYRHWLSLDPPSEEFRQEVAEHDRRLATLEEFAQRNQ